MGLWTEYKKKNSVDTTDTFLVYDETDGVRQVSGENVKQSFYDEPDKTLTKTGEAADSKIVGDRFAKVEKNATDQKNALEGQIKQKATGNGIQLFYDTDKGCMAAKITV